jgi:hypothetical protein
LKNIQIQKFCDNTAEGTVCDDRKEITEQPSAASAGRLVVKSYYAYKQ